MTMTMKRIVFTALLGAALLACGGDDESSAGPDARIPPKPDAMVPGPDAGPPGKPALGAQLDRMGRPAISTALVALAEADGPRGTKRDAYNKNGTKSTWTAMHAAEIAKNLAILDGLDATCGNQLLAGPTATAGRYDGLAGALADDQLYVKSGSATCTTYLAVEADATGVLVNNDCGGRKLTYDVVDASYSVLAAGALAGVDDGIAFTGTPASGFPYLGAPTN
jgi:hypothetical protein